MKPADGKGIELRSLEYFKGAVVKISNHSTVKCVYSFLIILLIMVFLPASSQALNENAKITDAESLINKVSAMCRSGNCKQPHKVIKYLDKIIKENPDDAQAFFYRGIAYSDLEQSERAIKDLTEAIRLKPDVAEFHAKRADNYGNLGKYTQAIRDHNEVVRLRPDDAYAYFKRGEAYFFDFKPLRALRDYNEAIRLKKDDADFYLSRGQAYERLGQYQQAIQDYNQYLSMKPDDADSYYYRGEIYYEIKQYRNAVKDYSRTIRMKPNFIDVYEKRAYAYFKLGNDKLGLLDAQKYCKSNNCEVSELYNRIKNPVTYETPGVFAMVGGFKYEKEVKSFFYKFQTRMKNNDRDKVARMVRYPIKVYDYEQDKMITVKDRDTFLKKWDAIFTEDILYAILNQKFEKLMYHSQGVAIGDGLVWFDKRENQETKIIAINN
jgi:tetratricopeptide (TPR) repeat protein